VVGNIAKFLSSVKEVSVVSSSPVAQELTLNISRVGSLLEEGAQAGAVPRSDPSLVS
jgi:hypothetical protein